MVDCCCPNSRPPADWARRHVQCVTTGADRSRRVEPSAAITTAVDEQTPFGAPCPKGALVIGRDRKRSAHADIAVTRAQ
jgi:hypothetical protein